MDKINKMSQVWIIKNYPDFFSLIDSKEIGRDWKEKLTMFVKNIQEVPKCYCGSDLDFISYNKGWKSYCSKKCVANSPDIYQKKVSTNLEKWGETNPMKNKKIKEKLKNNTLEKWGVDNVSKLDNVKNKVVETNLKKWGVKYSSQRAEVKLTISKKMKERNEILNKEIKRERFCRTEDKLKRLGLKLLESELSIYTVLCPKCDKEFKIHKNTLNDRERGSNEICTNCNPINSLSDSHLKIAEFISNLWDGEVILNDRKTIGLELDIFIPQLKLAFEYNGIYWHSDKFRDKGYHLMKVRKCEDLGIRLCHIWEDEWLYKREIVHSRIINLIGKSEKIGARKCDIRIVNFKNSKDFLNRNHSKSWSVSKVNIGLFYGEELVSLMTFGSLRRNLGEKRKDGVWEMIRFSNKNGISVIGGASKILNYFIINYKPKKIVSFSDLSWSFGNLYKKLGFQKVSTTKPNYFWTKGNVRWNRYNFRKDRLVEAGWDRSLSESEIMISRGFNKVWDCGSIKWELII